MLQLLRVKSRQRGSLATGHQSLAIAVRAKQAQLSIITPIHLHALEAFRGVVKARRRGRDAQVCEGLHLWRFPSSCSGPSHCDHVVRTVRVRAFLWGSRLWHIAEGRGASDLGGRCVQIRQRRSNRTHFFRVISNSLEISGGMSNKGFCVAGGSKYYVDRSGAASRESEDTLESQNEQCAHETFREI